jgi:hypothetical protein
VGPKGNESGCIVGIEVSSEIFRFPHLLAQQASGFEFAGGPLFPSEYPSDEEPPEWSKRDERWTIDGLLGCYDASQQRITIFNKGINVIAQKFGFHPGISQIGRQSA